MSLILSAKIFLGEDKKAVSALSDTASGRVNTAFVPLPSVELTSKLPFSSFNRRAQIYRPRPTDSIWLFISIPLSKGACAFSSCLSSIPTPLSDTDRYSNPLL